MLVARDTALPRAGGFTHALPFLHSFARRSAVSSEVKGNKRDRKDSCARNTEVESLLEIRIFFNTTRSIANLDIDPSQMLRDDAADA